MITNVSMTNFKPSFGFARLDEKGRAGADMLNYRNNTLTHRDTRPYDKPSFLHSYKKMPLASLMAAGHTFEEICQKYGSSDNAELNADFIKNSILSKKGSKFIKTINDQDRRAGLLELWDRNFDNPELSKKDTKALLELIKDDIDPVIYIQNQGILIGSK